MRSTIPFLALVLAVAPFASALDVVQAPRLAVGDNWDLAGGTSVSGFNTTIKTHEAVAALESAKDGNGASVDAIRTDGTTTTETVGSAGGFTFNTKSVTDSKTWARASDGAVVRVTSTTTSSGTAGSHTTTSETVYDAPCPHFQWPLQAGKTWTSTCTSKTTANGQTTSRSESITWKVLRSESVTVPAGTFDAFVLSNSTGQSVLLWYAPKACQPVKIQSSTPAGPGASASVTLELQAYACASTQGGGSPSTPAGGAPTPSGGAPTPTGSNAPTKTPAPAAALALAAVAVAAAGLARRARR